MKKFYKSSNLIDREVWSPNFGTLLVSPWYVYRDSFGVYPHVFGSDLSDGHVGDALPDAGQGARTLSGESTNLTTAQSTALRAMGAKLDLSQPC